MTEKRVHTRSQFFLLHSDGQPVPFFSFRPEDAIDATPGLVVDLSDGGLQILTANDQAVSQQTYSMELVVGERVGTGKKYKVSQVWSRPDGVNVRSGYAFVDGAAAAQEVGDLLAASERKILRCVLYPD